MKMRCKSALDVSNNKHADVSEVDILKHVQQSRKVHTDQLHQQLA